METRSLIDSVARAIMERDAVMWGENNRSPHAYLKQEYIELAKTAIAAMGDASTSTKEGVTSPASDDQREISVIDPQFLIAALAADMGRKDRSAYPNAEVLPSPQYYQERATEIIEMLIPHFTTREPVSVSLEKCARAMCAAEHKTDGLEKESWAAWHSHYETLAEAVLDAAGVKYVD